jgi:FkbM family methyltransferase
MVKELIINSGLALVDGKLSFPEFATGVKIDVGLSGDAPQSEIWTQNDPGMVVMGFEPLSKQIRKIENYGSSHPIKLDPSKIGKSVFIFPVALSSKSKTEKQKMHIVDGDAGQSSLLIPKNRSHSTFEFVSVYSLDDFLDLFPFDKFEYIDQLKVDAQGMDLEILRGATRNLSRVMYVTVEIDKDYEGTKNRRSLTVLYMARKGFILVTPLIAKILKKTLNHTIIVKDRTFINIKVMFVRKKNIFVYQE